MRADGWHAQAQLERVCLAPWEAFIEARSNEFGRATRIECPILSCPEHTTRGNFLGRFSRRLLDSVHSCSFVLQPAAYSYGLLRRRYRDNQHQGGRA